MQLTCLLADDEPVLRYNLHQRLESLWPELDQIHLASDGAEAWTKIQAIRPSVVFLDINMPAMTGLEVALNMQQAGLTRDCALVFLTAYDEFAVQAFEREAIDYLLKPVDDRRLQQTIERIKQRQLEPGLADLGQLRELLQQSSREVAPRWLNWFNVQQGEEILMISVDEVLAFRAEDKYTTLVTEGGEYLIRTPLKQLENQLDPERFWRIHRSSIVQVRMIEKISRTLTGQLNVKLKGSRKSLAVSRRFAERFRQS